MKKKIEISYGQVEYDDTPEIRDQVFERVMKYFQEYNAWGGEVIHQDDDCIIYAPNVLSDIADDIVKFKITSDDD